MHLPNYIPIILATVMTLQSCGIFLNPPTGIEPATLGEKSTVYYDFKNIPEPEKPLTVGVYGFKDQTGQYKASEVGTSWSTAVPQGLTPILIKSLEDSKWFVPIERENIGNLLNERQIIRSTRSEYTEDNEKLPPLLFAGILLEGGVISYDTNILSGGAGARYFGAGGSTQYRQDRITVYLRAVSTSTGKILKSVYVSKTILSQSINVGLFRYVDTERLLETELGVSNNEPVQMALTSAIDKAVYSLIMEGIKDNIWKPKQPQSERLTNILDQYEKDATESEIKTSGLGKRNTELRSKFSLGVMVTANNLRSDYNYNSTGIQNVGTVAQLNYRFSNYFSLGIDLGYTALGDSDTYRSSFAYTDVNLEYMLMPYEKFTPYVSAGAGIMFDTKAEPGLKAQASAGLEYLMSKTLSSRIFVGYHVGEKDDWDQLEIGSKGDQMLQFGIGLRYYF